MKRFNIKIEGVSPLLQHRFPIEQQTEGAPKPKKGNPDYKAEAENALYRDEKGVIYQPANHILSAIKEAGKKIKLGRGTFSKVFGSGVVIIEPDAIPHLIQKWELDAQPVVIQRARVVRYRPRLNEWALEFVAEIDDEEVSTEVFREALDIAGKRCGIGDFRPQRGGQFGRFMVTHFEEQR